MARWNRKGLDHEHTKFWKFDLKDVEEPNLQKDVFPYDEVCRIDFDHRIISINPAEDMFITDTTFRDGQQARPPYTVQQIVDLYTADESTGRTQRGDPSVGILSLQPEGSGGGGEVPDSWITLSGNHRLDQGQQRGCPAGQAGGPEGNRDLSPPFPIIISFSSWAKRDRQALEDYLGIVRSILDAGIIPRCHFEDITRGGHLRFLHPLCHRTDEVARGKRYRYQDQALRHDGIRGHLSRRRPAAEAWTSSSGPSSRMRESPAICSSGTATTIFTRP